MRKMISCVILCLLSLQIQAQTGDDKWVITGRLLEQSTGKPVEFTNVLLCNASDSLVVYYTMATEGGAFTLEQDKGGDYYLEISSLEYEKKKIPLPPFTNSQRTIALGDIFLEASVEALSEVVVSGRRRQVVYKLDRRVIEASSFLSAAGGTAVDILSQTPSISIDAEGEVTFRGSSGFKVYINGKPSSLEGSMALQQIPVGHIENIEVITAPSARNDADGTAGIININTKKQQLEGWSGIVNVMGSNALSRGIDFLVAHRLKDLRWQLSGEVSTRYRRSDFDQLKTITSPEMITADHSFGDRKSYTDIYMLRTGLDGVKNATDWKVSVEGGYRNRWRGGALGYEDTYHDLATNEVTTASFIGDDHVNLYEYFLRSDVGFNHRFAKEGHTLTGDIYVLYEGNAMEYFETNLYNMAKKREQGHKAWEYEYRFTAQGALDYVLPLAKPEDKLEGGYKFFTYTEDGSYTIDKFDPAVGSFVGHDELYNKYLFRRDIHALYVMLSNTWSRFSYQLGLRGEYTYRKLGNNIEWAQHTWHKFGLFPSAHLSVDLSKGAQTIFAYSRRVTQPQLFYMEPYVVYVDYYTAQSGNPFIQPEYTNSVEWGYKKSFSNSNLYGALFYRARKDKIERVRVPYQTGVTLDSMANVGNDYATGAEVSAMLNLNKWWNMDANGSLYYYKVKNEYKIDGKDAESWNWQVALNNNFEIGKNTRARLEFHYVGPSVSTQGRVEDFFYMNLSVRQQLFSRRLVASLSARDFLSTAIYKSAQSNINVQSITKIIPQSPVFTITLAYTFNNFRIQQRDEQSSHDLFEGVNR